MTNTQQTINNSFISKVVFDASQKQLKINFKEGKTYTYFNVPRNLYERFARAKSKGRFFARNIQGQFSYRKARSNKMIIPVCEYSYRNSFGKIVTVSSHVRTLKI